MVPLLYVVSPYSNEGNPLAFLFEVLGHTKCISSFASKDFENKVAAKQILMFFFF